MIFFDRFNIDELVKEYEHKVLCLSSSHLCHFSPTELIWTEVQRYYQNIDPNEFRMEAVEKTGIVEAGLYVCCCSLAKKQRLGVSHIIIATANLLEFCYTV
jgi:hypothetical protein